MYFRCTNLISSKQYLGNWQKGWNSPYFNSFWFKCQTNIRAGNKFVKHYVHKIIASGWKYNYLFTGKKSEDFFRDINSLSVCRGKNTFLPVNT